MWDIISNASALLSIISAVITFISALSIRNYYKKIVNQYSTEKVTIAEQKAFEAKRKYQDIKRMYMNNRGIKVDAFSDAYMDLDSSLDEIQHTLPVGYGDLFDLVKEAKRLLNVATAPGHIKNRSQAFLDIGTYLDSISEGIKAEKTKLQERNVKDIKGVG